MPALQASAADSYQLHVVEDQMNQLLLAFGKDHLNQFLLQKGTKKKAKELSSYSNIVQLKEAALT
jgi:hypothetical protein